MAKKCQICNKQVAITQKCRSCGKSFGPECRSPGSTVTAYCKICVP